MTTPTPTPPSAPTSPGQPGSAPASAPAPFVSTPNAEKYLLEADNLRRRQLRSALLHGSSRTWRDRRRIWPAFIAGLIVVAVISAAIGIYGTFQQQQRQREQAERERQEEERQRELEEAERQREFEEQEREREAEEREREQQQEGQALAAVTAVTTDLPATSVRWPADPADWSA